MSGGAGILSNSPHKMVGRRILRRVLPLLTHPLTKFLLILVGAGVTFQLLAPKVDVESGGRPKSFSELLSISMLGVGEYLPTWFGWWEVKKPIGTFHRNFPKGQEIEEEAQRILPMIHDLQDSSTYFRIFKVDLGKECPFWAREDLCSSPLGSCAVCECTEDQIPLPWRQKATEHFIDRRFLEHFTPWEAAAGEHMSGLTGSAAEAEDQFLSLIQGNAEEKRSTYVDLTLNPPGFTAYRGRNIWGMIYKENCIPPSPTEGDGECTEEDMFRHIISGLQTTIMVLSAEYNRPTSSRLPLPFTAPTWGRSARGQEVVGRHRYNMDLFRRRVAGSREWIENLYIDFSLLVRTLVEVKGIVESCPCHTGNFVEDQEAKMKLEGLVTVAQALPSAARHRLEVPMFERRQELALKQFANISRIFDCIECEKCRLHGKVKLTALQVAIKATGGPSSGGQKVMSLERNELTALINAIGYFADAIIIIRNMERRAHHLRALTGVLVLAFGSAMATLLLRRLRGGTKIVASDDVSVEEAEVEDRTGVDEVEELLAESIGLSPDGRERDAPARPRRARGKQSTTGAGGTQRESPPVTRSTRNKRATKQP